MIGRLFRVARAVIREHLKTRSPKWPHTRKLYFAVHPTCEACGSKKFLQCHHVVPFGLALQLGKPELELDLKNLISLCMGPHECHEKIGHPGGWHTYNPHVREDAAVTLEHPDKRKQIQMKALNLKKPIP